MSLDYNLVALVAAEHPIKTVTIFQSSTAEVMREITVDLQVCVSFSMYMCSEPLTCPLLPGRKERCRNFRHF